jgi:uncharacterized membrane protein
LSTASHLWAVGFDKMGRADEVRQEITGIAWGAGEDGNDLILLDAAVVTRHADGTFTFDRQPFPSVKNVMGCTAVGFLAGLVVAAPLTGATIGALIGGAGSLANAVQSGIDADFIQEVEKMMRPGTSALFLLDQEGNLEGILHRIRGLGGTVLKTNVDVERAKLIQSTLAG